MKLENDRRKKNANVAEKMICLNFAERNTTTYNNERFSMKWTNVTIYL